MTSHVPVFLTGSRAYGDPQPDADYDLVMKMTEEHARQLAEQFPQAVQTRHLEGAESIVFRFGPLNLIVVWSDDHVKAWRKATADCFARSLELGRGLTRDEAIEIHKAARKSLGFREGY